MFRPDERDALRSALHAALVRNVAPAAPCSEAALQAQGAGTAAEAAERAAAACLVLLATGNFPPAFRVCTLIPVKHAGGRRQHSSLR